MAWLKETYDSTHLEMHCYFFYLIIYHTLCEIMILNRNDKERESEWERWSLNPKHTMFSKYSVAVGLVDGGESAKKTAKPAQKQLQVHTELLSIDQWTGQCAHWTWVCNYYPGVHLWSLKCIGKSAFLVSDYIVRIITIIMISWVNTRQTMDGHALSP